ncbi:MAG: ABC transporter ATP-binding protein [Methylocystis sp.]|nr:ABC transporter ATP-binding protein [Methylocystis sp.]MCA3584033.1 ABC transporter ATP-binding protein [Methylocystis sp.]MCA3586677.1 ABC transporter ATP-binding protein [Methylocystis sp.]MCA3591647.1 ABC transporter ATP-binding protein [Methylocystis sp.]
MAAVPAATLARGRATAVIPAGLEIAGLAKSFGDRKVLQEINLTIHPAEVVCLLGPSGCGKTTLLRILAGIEDLSAGTISMDGVVIANSTASMPPERRGIGMVFQDYALFPQMTVLENVAFGLRALRRAEAEAAARTAMASVGLTALAGAYPHMLSGGEQQRVALARAIVPRPRVLLMDEPFSNLDRRMRDSVRDDTVALLRETGATCIMVTHDPEEAMGIADRIVLMRRGRIVQAGAPEELYHSPVDLEAARFFCDLNEVACSVVDGHADTPLGRVDAPGLPDGPASLCIRPQGFRLLPPGQGTAARIRSVRFLGETYLAELDVQGLDRPVRARLRERPPSSRRRDVGLSIDFDEVLVFGHQRA